MAYLKNIKSYISFPHYIDLFLKKNITIIVIIVIINVITNLEARYNNDILSLCKMIEKYFLPKPFLLPSTPNYNINVDAKTTITLDHILKITYKK